MLLILAPSDSSWSANVQSPRIHPLTTVHYQGVTTVSVINQMEPRHVWYASQWARVSQPVPVSSSQENQLYRLVLDRLSCGRRAGKAA